MPETVDLRPVMLKPSEFRTIRELLYERAGIDLQPGKETLVACRLSKCVREGGFRDYGEYIQHVGADRTGTSLLALIDALTTNHTGFLREKDHFEFLAKTVLPGLAARGTVDMWCAASSSGEEPYSILLTALDVAERTRVPEIRLTASDISTRVLAAAGAGIYPPDRVAPLPPAWINRYFTKLPQGYEIRREVRSRVVFRRINLIEPYPSSSPFAAIFCRNVMIYFDRKTQQDVVTRLSACLEPGGYLFVGHSESLTGIAHSLEYVRPAVYRRPVRSEKRSYSSWA